MAENKRRKKEPNDLWRREGLAVIGHELIDDEDNTLHDAIHGSITLTKVEQSLLGVPSVARLQFVHQMEADLSGYYTSASHDRLQHAIGAMHLAGRIGQRLRLSQKQIQQLRVAALLHDVGHSAFSHGSEPIVKKSTGMDHEQLGEKKLRENGVPALLKKHGLDFEKVLGLMRGKGLGEIITEYADRMDYLQRDAFKIGAYSHVQAGVGRNVEEVIENLRLHKGKLCVTREGEAAVRKFSDYRNLFWSELYGQPFLMLTRHLLRRALQKAIDQKVVTVRDLTHEIEHVAEKKLRESDIPEAEPLFKQHNVHSSYVPVFAANFTQLKSRVRNPAQLALMRLKIIRALRRSGLKEHRFYVDVTSSFEKKIKYRVVDGGKVVERTYLPETPEEDKKLFVAVHHEEAETARKAIRHIVKRLVIKQPHVPPAIWGGGVEKV